MDADEIGDIELRTFRTKLTPAKIEGNHRVGVSAGTVKDSKGVVKAIPLIVILLINNVLCGVAFVAVFNWWYKDQYQVSPLSDGSFRAKGTINTAGLKVEDSGDVEVGITSTDSTAGLTLSSKSSSIILDSHFTQSAVEFKRGVVDLASIATDSSGNLKIESKTAGLQLKGNLVNIESRDVSGNTGNVMVDGHLLVTGDTELAGSTTVQGNMSMEGDLTVQGDFTVLSGETMVQSLTSTGPVLIQDTLSVQGATTVDRLEVHNGVVAMHSGVNVTGGAATFESLHATGLVEMAGGLVITAASENATALRIERGLMTVENLTATGTVELQSDLEVLGHTRLQSLEVVGNFTATSDVQVTGTTVVQGLVSIGPAVAQSGLTVVDGDTNVDTLTANGTITANNGLTVTGHTSLGSLYVNTTLEAKAGIVVEGNASLSTLDVAGPTNLAGMVTMNNGATVDTLTVLTSIDTVGDLTVQGQTTVQDLDVAGLLTATAGMTVSGASTFQTINASGLVQLSAGLSVSGGMTVDTLQASDRIVANNGLDVTGTATINALSVTGTLATDTLQVQGATAVNTLTAASQINANNGLVVNGTATIDTLTASALVHAQGSLTVSGQTTMQNLTASGPVTLSSTLTVQGHTDLNTATVAGTLTANGGMDVQNGLTVDDLQATDSMTVSGTLNVTGLSTWSNVHAVGLVEMLGGMNVTGHSLFESLEVSGLLTGNSGLTVSGNTTLQNVVATGDVEVLANMNVLGNTTLQNLTALGLVRASGGLEVTGRTDVETLQVSGTVYAQSGLMVAGNTTLDTLSVTGAVSLEDTLTVQGHTSLNTLTASGAVVAQSTLNVTGQTTLQGLTALGAVDAHSTLTVAGTTTTQAIDANGLLSANAGLQVTSGLTTDTLHSTGNVVVDSNLTVSGLTSLQQLEVSGSTLLLGNLTVDGSTTMNSLQVQNTVEVASNLTVLGSTSVQALTANGLVQANAGMTVLGQSTLASLIVQQDLEAQSGLTVTGHTTLQTLETLGLATINAGLTVTGSTQLDTLDASGAVALQSTLDVQGVSTLSAVQVTGVLQANGGLTVTGTTQVDTLTATGLVQATNGLTVSGATQVQDLTASGAVHVANNLTVDGSTTLNTLTSLGLVTATNGLTVVGSTSVQTLQASGLVQAQAGLTVSNGATTVEDVVASGLITANAGLTVTGTSDLDTLVVNGVLESLSFLNVSGTATIASLNVTSLLTALSNVTVHGSTTVEGQTTVNGLLQALGGVTVTGGTVVDTLTASAAVTANAGLTVTGSTSLNTLTASGLVDAQSGLTVTGQTTLDTLTVSGAVVAAAGLNVTGATVVDSLTALGLVDATAGLTVTGQTTLQDVQVQGSLEVQQNLTVTGSTNLNTLTVSGAVHANGGLDVTGTSTFDYLTVSSNMTALGGLNVSGVAQLNDVVANGLVLATAGMTVTGTSTLDTLVVQQNTTIGGTLDVTGTCTLASLAALQNVQIQQNLAVTGTTSLQALQASGLVTASAGLNVIGATAVQTLQASGLVQANAGLTVTGATSVATLTASGLVHAMAGLNVTGTTFLENLVASDTIQALAGMTVSGNTQVNTLTASGLVTAQAGLTVVGSTSLDSLAASGAVTAGSLTVTGTSTLADVHATGDVTLDSTLTVAGATSLQAVQVSGQLTALAGLNVTGTTYLTTAEASGIVHATGGLNVTGLTTLNTVVATGLVEARSGLTVTGLTQLQTLQTSGLITAQAGLTVTGLTQLADLYTTGFVHASGDLTVDGTATVAALQVLGDLTTLGNLNVTGLTTVTQLTASGLVTANNGLQVTSGDTSVQRLVAAGLVEAQAGLTVTGTTSVEDLVASGDVTIQGTTTVSGVLYADGDITSSSGDLTIASASFLRLTTDSGTTAPAGEDAHNIFIQTQNGGVPLGTDDQGLNGGNIYITAGDGSDATGGDNSGGAGGSIIFDAGRGGVATGFGEDGADGVIDFRVNSVSRLEVSSDGVSLKSTSGGASVLNFVSNSLTGDTNFMLSADGTSKEFTITSTDSAHAFFRIDSNGDLHLGSPTHNVIITHLQDLGVSSTTGLEITHAESAPAVATGTITVSPGSTSVLGTTTRFLRDVEIGYRLLVEQDWQIYLTEDISFNTTTLELTHSASFFTNLVSINDMALVLVPVVSGVTAQFVKNNPLITIVGGGDIDWSKYIIPGYRVHFLASSCIGLTGDLPDSCKEFQGTISNVDVVSTSVAEYAFQIDDAPARSSFSGGDAFKLEAPRTIVDVAADGSSIRVNSGFSTSVFRPQVEPRALARVLVGRRVVSVASDTALTVEAAFTNLPAGDLVSETFYIQRHFMRATDFTGSTAFAWDATGRLGIGTSFPNADIHVQQHSASMLLESFQDQPASFTLQSGAYTGSVTVDATGDMLIATNDGTGDTGDLVFVAGTSTGGNPGAIRMLVGAEEVVKIDTNGVRLGPSLVAKSLSAGDTKGLDIFTPDTATGDAGNINLVAGTSTAGQNGRVYIKAGGKDVMSASDSAVTVFTDLVVNGTIAQGTPGEDLIISTPQSTTGDSGSLILEAGNSISNQDGEVVFMAGGELVMQVQAQGIYLHKTLFVNGSVIQGSPDGSDLVISTPDTTTADAGDILLTAGRSLGGGQNGQMRVSAGGATVFQVSDTAVTLFQELIVAGSIVQGGATGSSLTISTPDVASGSAGDLILQAGTSTSGNDGRVVLNAGGSDVVLVRNDAVEFTNPVVLHGDLIQGAENGGDLTIFTPDAPLNPGDLILQAGAAQSGTNHGKILLQAGETSPGVPKTVVEIADTGVTVLDRLVVDGEIATTGAGQDLLLNAADGDMVFSALDAVRMFSAGSEVLTVSPTRVTVNGDLEILSSIISLSPSDFNIVNDNGGVNIVANTTLQLQINSVPVVEVTSDAVTLNQKLVVAGSIVQADDGSDLVISTPDSATGTAGDVVLTAGQGLTGDGAVRVRMGIEDVVVVSTDTVEFTRPLIVAGSITEGTPGNNLTISTVDSSGGADSGNLILMAGDSTSGTDGSVVFVSAGEEALVVRGDGVYVKDKLSVGGSIVQGGPAGTTMTISTADGSASGDLVLATGVANSVGTTGSIRFVAGESEIVTVSTDSVQISRDMLINGSISYTGPAGSTFSISTPDTSDPGAATSDIVIAAGVNTGGGSNGTVTLGAGGADVLRVEWDRLSVLQPLVVAEGIVRGGTPGTPLVFSTPDVAVGTAGNVVVTAGTSASGTSGQVVLNAGGVDSVVVSDGEVRVNVPLYVEGTVEALLPGSDLTIATLDSPSTAAGDVTITAGGASSHVIVNVESKNVLDISSTQVVVDADLLLTGDVMHSVAGQSLTISTADNVVGAAGDIVLAAGVSGIGSDGSVQLKAGGSVVMDVSATNVLVNQPMQLSGAAPLVFKQSAGDLAGVTFELAGSPATDKLIRVPAESGTMAVSATAPLVLDPVSGDLSLSIGSGLAIVNGLLSLNLTEIGAVGNLTQGSITPGFGSIDVGDDPISGGTITLRSLTPIVLDGNGASTGSVSFVLDSIPTVDSTISIPVDRDGTLAIGATAPLSLDSGTGQVSLLLEPLGGLQFGATGLMLKPSDIVAVGDLTSGSIAPGFGPIDIGSSTLAAGVTTLTGMSPLVFEGSAAGGGSLTVTLAEDPASNFVLTLPAQSGTLAVAVTAPLTLDSVTGTVGLDLVPGGGLIVEGGMLRLNATEITSVGTLVSGSIAPGFGPIDIGSSPLQAGQTTLRGSTPLIFEGADAGLGRVSFSLAQEPVADAVIIVPPSSGTLAVSASDPIALDTNTGQVSLRIGDSMQLDAQGRLAVNMTSIVEVGALAAGSIVPGFGPIDIGASPLTAGDITVVSTTPLVFEGAVAGSGSVSITLASEPGVDSTIFLPATSGTFAVSATAPLALDSVTGDVSLQVGSGLIVGAGNALELDFASITQVGALSSGSIAPGFGSIDIGTNTLSAGVTTLRGSSPLVLEGAVSGDGNSVTFALAQEPSTTTTLLVPAVDGTLAVSATAPLVLDGTTGDVSLALGTGLTDFGGVLAVNFTEITQVGALSSGSIVPGFGPIDIGSNSLSAASATFTSTSPIVFDGTTPGSGSVTLSLPNDPTTDVTINVPARDGTLVVTATAPLYINSTTGDAELRIGSGLTDVGGALAVDFGTITTVGALTAGSIEPGFGSINIDTNPLEAGTVTLHGLSPIVLEGNPTDTGKVTLTLASAPVQDVVLTVPAVDGTFVVAAANPLSVNAGTGLLELAVGTGLTVDGTGSLAVDYTSITTVGTLTSGSIASGFGPINIGSNTLEAGVTTLHGATPLVFQGSVNDANSVAFTLVGEPGSAVTINVPAQDGTLAVAAQQPLALNSGTGELSLQLGSGLVVDVNGKLAVDFTSITTVGALTSGSIASGFGSIDIGTNTLSAGVATLHGLSPLVLEGTAGSGKVTMQLASDPATSSVITVPVDVSGTLAVSASAPLALNSVTGDLSLNVGSGLQVSSNQLAVNFASITQVGTLTSGSIGVGFGDIDISGNTLSAGVVTLQGATPLVFQGATSQVSLSLASDPASPVTLTVPAASGTLAVAASAPLSLNPTTGTVSLSVGSGLTVDGSNQLSVDFSSITTVGALSSGSIAPGFGPIDIGSNSMQVGALTLTDLAAPLVFQGGSGSVTLKLTGDPASDSVISLPTQGGTLVVAATGPLSIGSTDGVLSLAVGSGLNVVGNQLVVDTASITQVGTLTSGSIASGFGPIDIGSSTIECGSLTLTGTTPLVLEGPVSGDGNSVSLELAASPSFATTLKLPAVNGTLAVAAQDPLVLDGVTGSLSLSVGSGLYVTGGGALAVDQTAITQVGTLTSGSIAPGFGSINIGTSTLQAGQTTLYGLSPLVFEGNAGGGQVTLTLASDPASSVSITVPAASGTVAVSASDPLVLDPVTGDLQLQIGTGLQVNGLGELELKGTDITTVGALTSGSITSTFGPIDIGTSTLAAGTTTLVGLSPIVMEGANPASGSVTFTLAAEPASAVTLTVPVDQDGTLVVSAAAPMSVNSATGELSLSIGSGLTLSGSSLAVDFASITQVGTLTSGSIASGFGSIDIGTNALSAGQLTLSGTTPIVLQGASGSLSFTLSQSPVGANTLTIPATGGTLVVDAAAPLSIAPSTGVLSLDISASSILYVNGLNELDANLTAITSVGTLTSGSISSGFGNIDIGTNAVTAGQGTFGGVSLKAPAASNTCAFTTIVNTCSVTIPTDQSLVMVDASANYDTSTLSESVPSALPEITFTCGEAGYGQLITLVISNAADFPVKIANCYEQGTSYCVQHTISAATYICMDASQLYRVV